ncbi:MAG: hypothetical protein R2862_06775 [Thermoanaerobaculia bacterium]
MSSHSPSPGQPGGFDSEIDVRRVIEIAAWLAGITIGSLIVGYFLYKALGSWTERADPKPSPLAEARLPAAPPEPHLQSRPEVELQELRRSTSAALSSWGWVDRSAGIAHMPIENAIDRLAVPEPAAEAMAAPPVAAPEPAATATEEHTAPGSGH